jgi:hypothetical protein
MSLRQCLLLLGALGLTACGAPSGPEDESVVPDEPVAPVAPVEPLDPAESAESAELAVAAGLTAAQRAVEQLSSAYDELAQLVDRDPGQAVDWAQGDIENLGDWEYRIVEFDGPAEAIETGLNALGDERWEVYWIEPTHDGVRVYLKRPSISYLSRVPLSDLLRMFGGGGQ